MCSRMSCCADLGFRGGVHLVALDKTADVAERVLAGGVIRAGADDVEQAGEGLVVEKPFRGKIRGRAVGRERDRGQAPDLIQDEDRCVIRDANMGHHLDGGNSSWCPELESRTIPAADRPSPSASDSHGTSAQTASA